jgi:transposase
VIDRVWVDRANELRADRQARKHVKGARWLLLKNRNSMRPEGDVELEELLAATHDLFVIYVLGDALKDLWRDRHPRHAARAWRGWYRKTLPCRYEPLRRFARNLRPYLLGILAHRHVAAGYQPGRRYQQQDQGDQADPYGFRETPTSS